MVEFIIYQSVVETPDMPPLTAGSAAGGSGLASFLLIGMSACFLLIGNLVIVSFPCEYFRGDNLFCLVAGATDQADAWSSSIFRNILPLDLIPSPGCL